VGSIYGLGIPDPLRRLIFNSLLVISIAAID